MRIKFGNHVDLCKRVSYSEGNFLIVTTMYDQVYTINCGNKVIASRLYEEILVEGYLDVSEFEYSN